MLESAEAFAARIQKRFGASIDACRVSGGEVTVEVGAQNLRSLCTSLRDEEDFAFAQLVDLCAVDYLEFGCTDWETSESASNEGFSSCCILPEGFQESR